LSYAPTVKDRQSSSSSTASNKTHSYYNNKLDNKSGSSVNNNNYYSQRQPDTSQHYHTPISSIQDISRSILPVSSLTKNNNNNSLFQPRLKISQPGDVYEQEADRVAEQVIRMSTSDSVAPMITTTDEAVNLKCSACEMKEEEQHEKLKISRKPSAASRFEATDQVTNEINNIRSSSSGSPLDPSTKGFMESRFGYDFSNVKIHADETATRSANSVDALAYTVGNDIVFGKQYYQPNTLQGRRLLAHELTHVIQQSNMIWPAVSRPLSIDASTEMIAEQVSNKGMSSDQSAGRVEEGDGPSIQRELLVTAKPSDNKGLLARRPAPGHPESIEFRVGNEIRARLANASKRIAVGGVTKDELKGLRSVALLDETIDHGERGFLAGLLDSANASKVAGGGTSFIFTKASIDAHLAEVADLERPLLDEAVATAFKEKWMSVAVGQPGEVEKHVREEESTALIQITRLVGKSREPKLRSVVAFAAAHGVKTPQLLTAMLAGASDSTAGDMLMSATVYAVAAAIQHRLQHELLGGTIKVDQVPKAQMTGGADAEYSAEGMGKDKGDTIYVPESLSIDNAAHRSQIIHELEHAVQDQGSSSGLIRVEAELDGYRAQAKYLLDQIAPLKGAERDVAIKQTANIMNAILIRALILESRRDRGTFDLVIVDINSEMPANVRLGPRDLAAFIASNDAVLINEAKAVIVEIYKISAGNSRGPAAGFQGEHHTSRM
jgi:Domain of unknown function (DUF4157)